MLALSTILTVLIGITGPISAQPDAASSPTSGAGFDRGELVITRVDTWSDCGGRASRNHITDGEVVTKATRRFVAGELARVKSYREEKAGATLVLEFEAPVLARKKHGPFRLLVERSCKVTLVAPLDRPADSLVLRVADVDQARASALWNGREREPYPAGYEAVLAQYSSWKASRRNSKLPFDGTVADYLGARRFDSR